VSDYLSLDQRRYLSAHKRYVRSMERKDGNGPDEFEASALLDDIAQHVGPCGRHGRMNCTECFDAETSAWSPQDWSLYAKCEEDEDMEHDRR
jgi:hypothetical protein